MFLSKRSFFFSLAVPGVFSVSALFSVPVALAQSPERLIVKSADYVEMFGQRQVENLLSLDTSLVYRPHRRSEAENTAYCPTQEALCSFSVSRRAREHFTIELSSTPNPDAVRDFIRKYAENVNQEPKNAKFAMKDEMLIVEEYESVGRQIKEDESVKLLVNALSHADNLSLEVILPTETMRPAIMASDRERLGLVEMIGEGRTNFKGSSRNRIYNIKRSLQQFDGVIIAPNQEFSFVDYLGEVDGENGYLPELVIKHNRTEPEFGGGICQVSSTVFRAAIFSGLKITERRNHAYPVQYYYPYGMDATIYLPKPDLRFVNNTRHHILMQSTIEGTELIFRFFGTKDGRAVTVDGPKILERNPDGSMKTVFTQTVKDQTDKIMIQDSFWSNYKSPALFPKVTDQIIQVKPSDWSEKQWREYKKSNP